MDLIAGRPQEKENDCHKRNKLSHYHKFRLWERSCRFLSIKKHGNLFLYCDSDQRFPVWSEDCALGDTCEAQLLDSGNLVLVQASKGIVWQSFNFPTDTMLAGIKLGLKRKTGQVLFLTSWNFSSGYIEWRKA
ncbi:hypothetical protein H0E87_020336 [Populus deltoides]|uniref:Bulb-type lectin domain-containing protein n=1 Tax=Populus deltoides TaxID=3696 RepID=A0A8T2XJ40_POPDE|nr:hypothetical protein H0E87_020336 [Populus deltoides]